MYCLLEDDTLKAQIQPFLLSSASELEISLYLFMYCLLQDDTLKAQMQSFLLSTASQQEIALYDQKVNHRMTIVSTS